MLKNKSILLIILLTLLGVCGHYGVYTYITQLVAEINVAGGIEVALMVFGIGSLISIIIATKYMPLMVNLNAIAPQSQCFFTSISMLFKRSVTYIGKYLYVSELRWL